MGGGRYEETGEIGDDVSKCCRCRVKAPRDKECVQGW